MPVFTKQFLVLWYVMEEEGPSAILWPFREMADLSSQRLNHCKERPCRNCLYGNEMCGQTVFPTTSTGGLVILTLLNIKETSGTFQAMHECTTEDTNVIL